MQKYVFDFYCHYNIKWRKKQGGFRMRQKVIAILGAGPGLGNHIGEEFGSKGFHLGRKRKSFIRGMAA